MTATKKTTHFLFSAGQSVVPTRTKRGYGEKGTARNRGYEHKRARDSEKGMENMTNNNVDRESIEGSRRMRGRNGRENRGRRRKKKMMKDMRRG